MSTSTETSDGILLDLLRRSGGMRVPELVKSTGVTANAVRQRLARLMSQGLVDREIFREGRGRPSHRYSASHRALKRAGSNAGDLALILWRELRAVQDPEVRRGLLQRVADALAGYYRSEVSGDGIAERMESLRKLFGERGVELQVSKREGQHVLQVLDCPYPDLVQHDRGVCAMERLLFSSLLGDDVRLAECRLDGHACCEFARN